MASDPVSIVLTTVPNETEARNLAQTLLNEQLVACINIISNVTSLYTWKDNFEESPELLLIMKTRTALFPLLAKRLAQLHSYEVPEIISLSAEQVGEKYHQWITEVTKVS